MTISTYNDSCQWILTRKPMRESSGDL